MPSPNSKIDANFYYLWMVPLSPKEVWMFLIKTSSFSLLRIFMLNQYIYRKNRCFTVLSRLICIVLIYERYVKEPNRYKTSKGFLVSFKKLAFRQCKVLAARTCVLSTVLYCNLLHFYVCHSTESVLTEHQAMRMKQSFRITHFALSLLHA